MTAVRLQYGASCMPDSHRNAHAHRRRCASSLTLPEASALARTSRNRCHVHETDARAWDECSTCMPDACRTHALRVGCIAAPVSHSTHFGNYTHACMHVFGCCVYPSAHMCSLHGDVGCSTCSVRQVTAYAACKRHPSTYYTHTVRHCLTPA